MFGTDPKVVTTERTAKPSSRSAGLLSGPVTASASGYPCAMDGITFIGTLDRSTPVVTTPQAQRRLRQWGFEATGLLGKLTGAHLDTIHERHPDIDVAVVHLGGTRVLFHTVTMDAEQGVDLVRRVDPDTVVPVRYDDYRVSFAPRAARG